MSFPKKNITDRCFVNAPWQMLKTDLLELFLKHGIQPEIGLEGTCLYNEDPAEFRRVADILRRHHLACTLHAPFFDLAPGALDPYILAASREKLRRAFDLLAIFKPRSIVCHLQFETNKQGYKLQEWTAIALATWQQLLHTASRQKIPIMLENTYEKSPDTHQAILSQLNSPYAGFCLDVGHLMTFAHSPWQEWLPSLSPWLGQLHLHDNNGESDQHLAPGRGLFNFPELFAFLRANDLHPIVTFEPHSRDDLWQTFAYLEETGLLADI
jgi:sugar phosphate isomerase/epimerase